MDITNARTGWIVAGVLAVVVVVLAGFLWKMQYDLAHDLDYVLDQNGDEIMAVRAEIADKCSGENPLEQAECQDTLDELADVLRDFSRDLDAFATTSTSTSTSTNPR